MAANEEHYVKYSIRYEDNDTIYRHVKIPPAIRRVIEGEHTLLLEHEWRSMGLQQSPGWINYATHGDVLLMKVVKMCAPEGSVIHENFVFNGIMAALEKSLPPDATTTTTTTTTASTS